MIKSSLKKTLILFLPVFLLLAGCAGHQAFIAGEEQMQAGQYDEAVENYSRAVDESPNRKEFKVRLTDARVAAARMHVERGQSLVAQGQFQEAVAEFQQAAALDPSADVALGELKKVQGRLKADQLVREAEDFYRARKIAQARNAANEALQLTPGHEGAQALLDRLKREHRTVLDGFELDVTSDKPITLKFKDADVKDAFNILSKLSGINFIFDEEIKSQKVSVFLENATFAQALELLLNMNKLGKKVLNAKTIIIYPKSKEKEKQFEDQIIQTFYLSNIDAKKAVNLLRTMLQLRKVYVHEELNALVIRDTPAVITLAQQVIESADRPDAEVLFELELIGVTHTNDQDLGARLSNYSTNFGWVNPGTTALPEGSVTVSGLSDLEFLYTIPTATFNFKKTLRDTEILASPKIRVKNKEKAKVHIGDREPIITVTINGDQTTENIQYVDVGVKLDIEPNIQLDDSVFTKINVEVSSVTSRETTDNGTSVVTITTTNAQSGLTLKDGQQTVIGGLIRDDSSKTKDTIPFLGDLPLIGNLISAHLSRKTKQEILLSITPHIVTKVEMPRSEVASIWSGGEDDLKAGPNFAAFAAAFEPVTDKPSTPAAPALIPGATTMPGAIAPTGEIVPVPLTSPGGMPPTPPEGMAPSDVLPTDVPMPTGPGPAPAEETPGTLPSDESSPIPALSPEAATPEVPSSAVGSPTSGVEPSTVVFPAPVVLPAPAVEPVPTVVIPPLEIPPPESRVFLSGPATVKSGEEFAVAVDVDGMQQLYSAPLFVSYDGGRLEFVRAEEGDFLKQGGSATIFTTSAMREKGQLIVGHKQGVGGAGASGSGTLFRLFFRAKAVGQTKVELDRINFRDPAGNRLTLSAAGFALEVR